jgi:5,10-methenyltetrahydrofolate synthetase
MQEGAYGIQEPLAGATVTPELILVPTLGYTAHADRVGYGGGYYDRTLAALKAAGHTFTTIGIAWTSGRLDDAHVPEAHDVRLDAVLTPDGWVPKAP